jgi:hypothetical protein
MGIAASASMPLGVSGSIYAPRRERQYLRRALGIVGFFGCG